MEVLEGQSCSFECVLSHESTGDAATWTVGGKMVGDSGRFRATRQGRKYTLAVRDAAASDAGEVVFSMRDLTSKASLIVRGEHHPQGRLEVERDRGLGWALLGLCSPGLGSFPGGAQRHLLRCWGFSFPRELTPEGEIVQCVGGSRVSGVYCVVPQLGSPLSLWHHHWRS